MRISLLPALALLVVGMTGAAHAALSHDQQDHPTIFHYSRLEVDVGDDRGEVSTRWDLDAWVGGDFEKLWIKSRGDVKGRDTIEAEFWGLYSRNIAMFWDVQAGIRQDTQPKKNTYLTFGFEGLAPYYFETESHVFISDRGAIGARIKERNDLLITQRLIAQPYAEVSLYAQNDPKRYIGSGVAAEAGLQTRYEFTRQFAPYVDLRYEAKFGQAARQAVRSGDDRRSFIAAVGLRLLH